MILSSVYDIINSWLVGDIMESTKLRISEALLDLLKEDDLIDIQMKEIADKAEISDRSIRRHFKGKQSILLYYMKYLISTIDFSSVKSTIEATLKYIEFWSKEIEIVDLLRKRELLYIITMSNMEYSKESLDSIFQELYYNESNSETKEYLVDLIIHMEVSMFHTWLTNDYDLPLDKAKEKLKESYNIFRQMDIR